MPKAHIVHHLTGQSFYYSQAIILQYRLTPVTKYDNDMLVIHMI